MPSQPFPRKSFTTNDGVRLSFIDAGSGLPVIMLHGWSQCAEMFKYQVKGFCKDFRIIALDQRGHGQSAKPEYGYRISRLAKDLHELIANLKLDRVILLGHSMGCSVIWAYWDQFGGEQVEKLILVDEPVSVAINPAWSQDMIELTGAVFTPAAAYDVANSLNDPAHEAATRSMIGSMLTKDCPQELKNWIIECNLLMPRKYAAQLLLNNIFQDWRDVIPRLKVPTLIVGGKASVVSWKAMRHLASQIENSQLEIFGENEGGSHFMFLENPEKFNRIVLGFLQ